MRQRTIVTQMILSKKSRQVIYSAQDVENGSKVSESMCNVKSLSTRDNGREEMKALRLLCMLIFGAGWAIAIGASVTQVYPAVERGIQIVMFGAVCWFIVAVYGWWKT